MRLALLGLTLASAATVAACAGDKGAERNGLDPVEAGVAVEASVDAAPDAPIDKAAGCAKESELGTELTSSFGRADGVVTAIVGPTVTTCALPNSDHVVVQMKMNGAIYRMVVNVASTRGTDLRVRFATIDHGAVDPTWSEGWHTDASFDYATTLGVHSADPAFAPYEMLPLAEKIEGVIDIGKPISVYAWSSGGASAHKVHRNGSNSDGAIVIDPAGPKPKWMLFHFAGQTF